MKLTGKQTWVFEHPIFVNSAGTAAGPKEKDGPLGSLFDKTYDEMHCNQKLGNGGTAADGRRC